MVEPVEDNGGISNINGVGVLGLEVELDGVGEGGGHYSSTELTTRNSIIPDNLAFSSEELAVIVPRGEEDSGVDGGNSDGFGGVGGDNQTKV